ncbi:hypothetical protein PLESTB_000731600 [Pleodorina starrii]|uniref:Uncharacterized protein n=1 Tax=Pleodorina starrii TaxID=330485 RepID=A0A9W6BK43_9CHLO|nr:hypothetical protein PLESTM_000192300 [Pleodorina starrii]GLC53318.1 hypothetical protein PLESTB_000731600 [Pleodorina starrii]GLC67213.1 hypothetical protein PLESTF_000529700 [Pleodorina starrii]
MFNVTFSLYRSTYAMNFARPCGGVLARHAPRSTSVAVSARQSNHRQEWRSNGPSGRGRGRGGRGPPARGRGGRTGAPPRTPSRLLDDDDYADGYGPSSRSAGATAPRPARRDQYDSSAGRRTLEPQPPRAAPATPSEPQDPFGNLNSWIQTQHRDGVVVRRETWEKLLGHVRSPAQADSALELLVEDSGVREAAGWDWATHGYGQTAFQLVQVAAAVGAPEVAERLLERREALHLNLNKDLLPTLIRKVAAATADAGDDGGSGDADVDACVEVVQRLYEQEVALRGANSPEAAYELSRVLRRAGDVRSVRSLHAQMQAEDLAVRDRLLEDLERWLAKRGVRV